MKIKTIPVLMTGIALTAVIIKTIGFLGLVFCVVFTGGLLYKVSLNAPEDNHHH